MGTEIEIAAAKPLLSPDASAAMICSEPTGAENRKIPMGKMALIPDFS